MMLCRPLTTILIGSPFAGRTEQWHCARITLPMCVHLDIGIHTHTLKIIIKKESVFAFLGCNSVELRFVL